MQRCTFRNSQWAPEGRCASDAEEQSALYNMACAYAAMAQRESALTCLEVRLQCRAQRTGIRVLAAAD